MKHLEVLRAELERLFVLDELTTLSRDVLGFDPELVGGQATLGSFAGALVAQCTREDAIDALADALRATGRELSPAALSLSSAEPSDDAGLSAGTEMGPFCVMRKLGDGRLGSTYLAKFEGRDVRLKVLHPESARDRRGLARYLVLTRLAAQLDDMGLAPLVFAGPIPMPVGEDRVIVAHEYVEGQPLSARIARSGPMHVNEARALLRSVAETLLSLHDKKLVHGALSLDNLVVYRTPNGETAVNVLDAGTDRLRTRQSRHRTGLSSTGGNPRTVSPEQIRGADADRQSDVYSLGAVMYELLTGKPPFDGDILEIAYGHLTKPAPAPSSVAPRGWVSAEIDEVLARLLAKAPADRGSIREYLSVIEDLGRPRSADSLSEAQIEELEQQLLGDPTAIEVARELEAAVGRGATADRVGQAFRLAASMIDDPVDFEERKLLLLRAARLFETKNVGLDKAEAVYEELLGLAPDDEVVWAGLEEVRRRAGKHNELIEMLLARAEAAPNSQKRARAMSEIGRIYLRDLSDQEQATVAFAQAFCDDPSEENAVDVERAAGTSEQLWAEALASIGEATEDATLSPETRSALLVKAGSWYRTKVARPDLALPCFQAVLAGEPSNETALSGLTEIYKKAQQWQELGMILTHRADAAATPTQARNLRAEAAEVLEQKIGDLQGARSVYEHVLSEDPSHERAVEALARILEKSGDFAALVGLLDRRLSAQPKADAIRTLCRIGEIFDDRLNNPDEASARFKKALDFDPTSLDALRGLERLFTRQGKYRELVENLDRQVEVAATPKQRIALFERIASVYEEEFLDHKAAAEALERALEADPGRVSAMAALIRHLRVLERWEEASRLYERQLAIVEGPERVALALAWGRLLAEQQGFSERAVHAYELVLEVEPDHAVALEALAKLQETTGDADRALDAILAIADQAETPQARSEQYVRAAKLLEARGNRDLAIEHYRNALDATPEDRSIAAALRIAYVRRGDINAAVELLEREIEVVEGDRAQARLAGEMARLQLERLKDDRRAEQSAERALRLDPSNTDGLLVLGDICFKERRFVEASAHYGRIGDRIESLGPEVAVGVLERYVDAMSQSGSTEGALAAVDTLLRLAPDDAQALSRVAQVTFEHGSPGRAVELLESYLGRFGAEMTDETRSLVTYRYGEALRKTGENQQAIAKLEEAAELDPSATAPLVALATAYADVEDLQSVLGAKTRHLDLAEGDDRVQLLLEIGDLCGGKLGDRAQATRSYVAALEERPDDRRLLTKLMQLYSEDKDWNKLVDVVVKLADFVEDPGQKVKYLQTAALVAGRHIGDHRQAAGFFTQVLEIEPENDKALLELTELERQSGNFSLVEDLLKRQLVRAETRNDVVAKVSVCDQLAELYEKHLVAPHLAAQALEAAFELDRDNKQRLDRLVALYSSDPETFKEKGIALQEYLLSQNPFRQDAYKALRKIYTVARDADASWALCQVLTVLKLAEPDEERFYGRMRAETAAPAQEVFNEEDWHVRIAHPSLNPLLTSVFTLIELAVVRARALPIEQLGLSEQYRIEPSQHEAPLSQTLYYAAGVLGVALPRVYLNPNDPGGLGFLFTAEPSLSMGRVGLSSQVPPQVAAFVAARQLAYTRPGLYLRHFIQTGTALKAWLFAAIKLSSPQFPVAADIEGSVNEALAALKQFLPSDSRDHLGSIVSKLIQSGTALDLKKWIAAVDLTADRAGFIVSHDLDTTTQVIRASDDSTAAVPSQERFKEVVLYAASHNYFTMRRRLGITVEN